jgi:hypothetical protein
MSAIELQSAMSDTLLQMVLQQKAQTKQRELSAQQELLEEQAAISAASSGLSSKVYAKAA